MSEYTLSSAKCDLEAGLTRSAEPLLCVPGCDESQPNRITPHSPPSFRMYLKRYISCSGSLNKLWQQYIAELSPKTKLARGFSTTPGLAREQLLVKSPYSDVSIPNKTFTELIWERHHKWKNLKAVICGVTGEEYSYSELKERSFLIGKSLINEGLRSGDVVALLLPNSPQFISIILGASERGLTICSINPLYKPDEISYQLVNSGAKKIITFPEKVPDVMKAINNLKASKSLPSNFKVLCTKSFQENKIATPKDTISLDDLVNRLNVTDEAIEMATNVSLDSLAFISHSSGTTGLPKGVCLQHKAVTASIIQVAEQPRPLFKETNDEHQDVVPVVLPIFHNFALEISLCSLYHGSKIVTLPKFEDSSYLSTLKEHKATMLFVVPPMLIFFGSNPSVTEEHFQSVRCLVCGAAPVGHEDVTRFLEKAKHVQMIQGYGLTEAMCFLTVTPYGLKNYQSAGVPLANTAIKIVDLETGESKAPNEEGEICFKGPQMSLGYLNNPEATREAIDEEGWFHTGDIGYYDKDGLFYIIDRSKELIKVKGFQVAPAELEHLLRSYPGIEAAAVIGVPDHRKGEVPIGFIKTMKGATVEESSIREFLAEKVAAFKLIDKYVFLDSIPTSASGKILRKELKAMYLSMK